MEKEIRNKLSLRFLKENNIYLKWRYYANRENFVYCRYKAWLGISKVNTDSYHNILQYGFDWSATKDGHFYWASQRDKLVKFLNAYDKRKTK